MTTVGIDGVAIERLSTVAHQARVFGPRPGVPNGSANDPANLFVVDLRQHPFGVGAGFPEPAGLAAPPQRGAFFRGTEYGPADQERLSAAMVDQFGDGAIFHSHYAWGPNFYGSGPTFARVSPEPSPWVVVTYLQALAGAGAEQQPNVRVALDASVAVSFQALCQALSDRLDATAFIVAGVALSAFLSSRDWIKPAVFGERYGLKMDDYRTRITISNPTYQALVAYVERGGSGQVAIHTHVGALWGAEPERLFAYAPGEPEWLLGDRFRMKHLYHINHSPARREEDSTFTRAMLYVYITPSVERIME